MIPTKVYAVFLAVLIGIAPCVMADAVQAKAQNTDDLEQNTGNIKLDDRGDLPVPHNLTDLKNLGLALWVKFHKANLQAFRYVREAAQVQAYSRVCKRHKLNFSMTEITQLSNHYIQTAIPVHFEELEYALLKPLSKTDQRAFFEDMSSDIYGFEYGYRTHELEKLIDASDTTNQTYCRSVDAAYKDSYIALRATAKRRLAEMKAAQNKK